MFRLAEEGMEKRTMISRMGGSRHPFDNNLIIEIFIMNGEGSRDRKTIASSLHPSPSIN